MAAASGERGTSTSNKIPKTSIFRSLIDWWFPVASSEPEDKESEDIKPLPPSNPSATRREQARAIDRIFDERAANEVFRALTDPTRRLKWNLNITPNHDVWKVQHARFEEALKTGSVQEVIDDEFEEAQRLLAFPASRQGAILDIQTENTKKYKQALQIGVFAGQKDNLTTKLTMLKFGLPIEPITMNNLLNAGKDLPHDDPEDGPADLPTQQRIVYAEKPLEFLGVYHERSYGLPIIRRRRHPDIEKPPISFPQSSLSIASTPVAKQGEKKPVGEETSKPRRNLEGPKGETETADDTHTYFREAALKLLDLDEVDPNHDTRFEMDFYSNQLDARRQSGNIWLFHHTIVSCAVDFKSQYERDISERFFGPENDWIIIVHAFNPEKKRLPNPIFPLHRGLGFELPNETTPKPAYTQANLHGPNHQTTLVKNTTAQSFQDEALKLLGIKADSNWNFQVYFYSNQLDGGRGKREFHHKLAVSKSKFGEQYLTDIRERLFDGDNIWILKVGLDSKVQSRPPPDLVLGFVYGYSGKRCAFNTFNSFSRATYQLLRKARDEDRADDFAFFIDIHSGGVVSPIRVTRDTFTEIFRTQILPQISFGGKWSFFVRIDKTPSATLEPPRSMSDIIKFHYNDAAGLIATAYWKIPRNLLHQPQPDYGHNQFQESFFRSMEIIYPPDETRPRGRVHIQHVCLGPGGMDFPNRFLEGIIRGPVIGCKESLELIVRVWSLSQGSSGYYNDNWDTIRLVGTQHLAAYIRLDFDTMYEEILGMTRAWTTYDQTVEKFRIWASQELRERNGPSETIAYEPKTEAVKALRTFITSQSTNTQCVAFRAEYVKFQIQYTDTDLDPSVRHIEWDAAANDNSFTSFRGRVKDLFMNLGEDPHAADMFYVTSRMGGLKHVVTCNTTEEEWRRNVFDWLHSRTIHVRRASGLDYGNEFLKEILVTFANGIAWQLSMTQQDGDSQKEIL
jgi:hypothetical protein